MMINGNPASFFKSTKGLSQGDPLSPYLFLLGMEVFNLLIEKAKRGGYLSNYNIGSRNGATTNISHLLFSNDTLVFYKDSKDEMLYLSWISYFILKLSLG